MTQHRPPPKPHLVTAPTAKTPVTPPEPDADTLLQVVSWTDSVIDQLGHDPRSRYVERFWLAILGPSTTWLVRRLASGFDDAPDGYELDLTETARGLGLGSGRGRNAPFGRALRRTVDFGLARHQSPDTLAVRRRLPPLNRGHVRRLPATLQQEHDDWVTRSPSAPSPTEMQTRARRLALSLVDLGEDRESVERQLHRWRFHPALAYEASSWAFEFHERRRAAPADAADDTDGHHDLPPSA